MEFSESSMVITFTLALVTVLFIHLVWTSGKSCKKRVAPEAPGKWPIIGHLPLLAASKPTHRILGNMADNIGPIFTMKIGQHRALVVNNLELARECLTTNDRAFASRPKAVAFEILGYNNSLLGTIPYGDYWRQLRKIMSLHVLSNHRLEMLKHVRETEVKEAIRGLYQKWMNNKNSSNRVFVEMKRWFWDVNLNLILKIVVGKGDVDYSQNDEDVKESQEWRKALRDTFVLAGTFVVSDALPFLKWLDIGGHQKAMKRTAKEIDDVLEDWLQQHKQNKASGVTKPEEDFMDVLLSNLDDAQKLSNLHVDDINKATCLGLILAASDTNSIALTWTLSLLLNNPDVLKKAQSELDIHVGRERKLMESDTKNLVYLHAIIKESLRLYPPAPILLPHESMEDCNVGGFDVPAGTRLIVNAFKIQRDSRIWSNPSKFKPERFLTSHKDVDVTGQNFELIPFGSGRRMCPGLSFALQALHLTIASLLHSFDIETSTGQPVDMSESIGITNLKATPIEVLLYPRLPPHIY